MLLSWYNSGTCTFPSYENLKKDHYKQYKGGATSKNYDVQLIKWIRLWGRLDTIDYFTEQDNILSFFRDGRVSVLNQSNLLMTQNFVCHSR